MIRLERVTSTNHPAMRFYESLAFTFTGHTEPYPNDPALMECERSRPISPMPESSIPASRQ